MKSKNFWRIALVVMVVGLLAFGALAFAGNGGYPFPCEGPLVDPITGDDVKPLIQTSQENPAFPDPNPAMLESPDECQLIYLKLEVDDSDITNSQEFTATDGFRVTIYKGMDDENDIVFAFDSNYPIFHVFAKGGPDEGNLYSYYPTYPNGVYNDCGLKQSDQGGWSHIAFYYCVPQPGCLEITKTFAGYPQGYELPDVVVDVIGPNGYDEEFVLNSDNGWFVEVCDLLPGEYTVTEREVTGWTTSYTSGPTVTVTANDTAEVDIKNSLDLGCMELTKAFAGLNGVEFPLDEIDVQVTGVDVDYDEVHTLKASDNWTKTICGLVPGTYEVVELTEEDGWSVSYNPTDRQVTVEAGDEPGPQASITITNTFGRGCLTVNKDFVNPDTVELPDFIEVQVTGDNYDETFKLDAGNQWSVTICDLIPGDYTVTELDIDGWTTSYSPGQTVEVIAGDEESAVEINITNTFIPGPTGSITIGKIVVDDDGDVINDDETFTVTLTGPNGYSNTFNITAGQTVPINGLALGTYSVTEADKNGYELVSITPDNFVLGVDNLNISVTIINEMLFEDIIVDPEEPGVDPEDPEEEEEEPLPQTSGTSLPLIGLGILLTGAGVLSKRKR